MDRLLRVVVVIPAVIFILTAIRYNLDPAGTAAEFGMPLLEGLGRSTQIGNMSSFFFTAGIRVLLAVSTGNHFWYYPAAMLTGLTAIFRIIAWLVHDASFAISQIAPEIIFTCLFLFAAKRFCDET